MNAETLKEIKAYSEAEGERRGSRGDEDRMDEDADVSTIRNMSSWRIAWSGGVHVGVLISLFLLVCFDGTICTVVLIIILPFECWDNGTNNSASL